jgi:hypothetical protein
MIELERDDGVETRLRARQPEEEMRKFVLTMAAVAALVAGGMAGAPRAEALPVSGNIAVQADQGLLQDAAYVCSRAWRCGRYGCGWRRACFWRPGPYWGYRHYGWRHRHWHRW